MTPRSPVEKCNRWGSIVLPRGALHVFGTHAREHAPASDEAEVVGLDYGYTRYSETAAPVAAER